MKKWTMNHWYVECNTAAEAESSSSKPLSNISKLFVSRRTNELTEVRVPRRTHVDVYIINTALRYTAYLPTQKTPHIYLCREILVKIHDAATHLRLVSSLSGRRVLLRVDFCSVLFFFFCYSHALQNLFHVNWPLYTLQNTLLDVFWVDFFSTMRKLVEDAFYP